MAAQDPNNVVTVNNSENLTLRPDAIKVTYTVNGNPLTYIFKNPAGWVIQMSIAIQNDFVLLVAKSAGRLGTS